jgi:hypothetical protein
MIGEVNMLSSNNTRKAEKEKKEIFLRFELEKKKTSKIGSQLMSM